MTQTGTKRHRSNRRHLTNRWRIGAILFIALILISALSYEIRQLYIQTRPPEVTQSSAVGVAGNIRE